MAYALHSIALPRPGLIWGLYPEKRTPVGGASWAARMAAWSARIVRPGLRFHAAIASRSEVLEQGLAGQADAFFAQSVRALRQNLSRQGLTPELIAHAFALVSLASQRHLGLAPFATQRIAASIMLDNQLAEMATGEGKTLVAALVAATSALAGMPVHVLTANDYLVMRDAARLQPVYAALGLSVGAIQQNMDSHARRTAYACDITYCTAKELVFDYLRDQPLRQRTELSRRAARLGDAAAAGPRTLLRGLCMAVVDEADSILIDEARVPLVISELHPDSSQDAAAAELLQLARALRPGEDFLCDAQTQSVVLTEAGRATLDARTVGLHAAWRSRRVGEENLCLALAALHLFQRDRHYLVRDGVHIIDETTGRLAPGRTWSRGLHQFIEIKEGCKPSSASVTRAQITYQRFFPRYLRLCGMSGTLAESRSELRGIYALPVVRVPLRKESRRIETGHRVFLARSWQWEWVSARARELRCAQRAVLIGTDSVAESESLSAHLTAAGLPHAVLNARNDGAEASIVAQAGQPGRVTIATNMAGRGTDIPLHPEVAAQGGLHVISCQLNSARRIDRQLKGRCARQGDPGSVETALCLDAPVFTRSLPQALHGLIASLGGAAGGELPGWLGRFAATLAQRSEEARHQAQRAMLLHQDRMLDREPVFRD